VDPLATVDDLDARLGRTLTGVDADRANQLLRDASGAFRRAAGQQISAGSSTARLRPMFAGPIRAARTWDAFVRLRQRPATAVASVIDAAGNPVEFEWLGDDRVAVTTRASSSTFDEVDGNAYGVLVDVTYSHGYDEIPDDVVAVVCQMVGRALAVTPDKTAYFQRSIDNYAETLGSAAAGGAVGMLPAELKFARTFRRTARTVALA
jgi:hypothetical protein